MKKLLKTILGAIATVIAFPWALLSGFGRWPALFELGAQFFARAPGIPGSYLRVAYYKLTLEHVGEGCHIAMGSYFAHPQSSIGNRVGLGAYCVLGCVSIDDGTIFGSGAQVLSGLRQHSRDKSGQLTGVGRRFDRVTIGRECWIGAAAIVMANLGDMVTVSPGSVVSSPVSAGVVVVGNPARPVRVISGVQQKSANQSQ